MFRANLILNITIILNNILNIEGASVLNKEQQKSILGGEGSGTCGYIVFAPEGFTPTIRYGVDRETAWQALAAGTQPGLGHWCCDNCDTATWLDGWDINQQ